MPNGVITTQSLDPAGRLTSTESKRATTVLQRFAYEYKQGANQQALVSKETDKDGVATSYGYDVANRLTGVAGGSSFAYAYDSAGNLTSKTAGGATTTYRHNQANQLCWKLTGTSSNGCGSAPAGATTYAYDAAGNETSASGTRSSVYNVREQLSSLTPSGLGAVAMGYAGPGHALRIKKGPTTILNNQFGIGSHTTAGTPDYYTHDENGAVVTQRRPSASSANKRTYLLTDQLGSTRTLTDANGTVVRRYAYEPYGADKSPTGTWTTQTPFQFAGGEKDATGLYHFGERYYDPANGRWTQTDPINQYDDLRQANQYTYAADDPINRVDPTGTVSFKDGLEVFSLVETAAYTVASGALAVGGTASCVAATAGVASVACAGIALSAGSAAVGGAYVTYRKTKKLIGR